MGVDRKNVVVLGSVAVGSLLLVGPLTYGLLVGAVDRVADLAGLGPIQGWARGALVLGSALVALEAADEVAMIRIHGYRALRRGDSRLRVFARHAALVAPVLAGGVFAVDLLVMALRKGTAASDPVTLGLVAVIAGALCWSAIRTVRSYRRGRRGDGIGAIDGTETT